MTLPLWPASPIPDTPYAWKPIRRVKKGGPFGGDRWLSRPDNRFPLMQIGPLTWVSEDPDGEIRPLVDFWNAVGGPAGVFDFKDLNMWDGGWLTWTDVFAGQIAASTLDYDLPIATSTGTGFVFKLDGVSKTVQRIWTPGIENGTSDVYLYPGAGANGRDLGHTRVQQTVGAIVTVTGKGQRIATVQVLEEEPQVSWGDGSIYTFGPVTFLEVR